MAMSYDNESLSVGGNCNKYSSKGNVRSQTMQ